MPPAAVAVAPGSPLSSATFSESNPPEVNPEVVDLVRDYDQACGRYSAASIEIERLQESLRAVEVARAVAEEEAIAASAEAADAQARAIGKLRS